MQIPSFYQLLLDVEREIIVFKPFSHVTVYVNIPQSPIEAVLN